MELQVFTYDNLKSFTNDFHDTNFIGKFQFGRLFHGMIGSQPVTVKIWEDPLIYRVFYEDNEQRFKDEISFLTHPTGKHPNLLNLIGYCYEGETLSVVYDVKALGILHDLLLKDDFTWLQRIKAALGFAFLLERLHEESTTDLPYLLRNIGAVNIMLDQDYNPKLCDVGMISGGIFPDRTLVRRVRISGCYGYIDPFYARTGEISEESDVFAFGVILLNLIAKRIYTEEERDILAPRVNDWAKSVYCPLSNCSLVHQSLQTGTGFYFSDGVHITELAMKCVEREPWNRPTMSEVLNCLLKLHVVHGHAGFMGIQQKVIGLQGLDLERVGMSALLSFMLSQYPTVPVVLFFPGFGWDEDIVYTVEHMDIVQPDSLPEERPRLICGLGLPEEVLQGDAAGIDLFDSAKDITPIVESCKCYTCQNHTKAYINHLLNVHEMLAQILLEIHNTHHYLGFFRSIREAIKEGKFEQFRQNFVQSKRDHLATTAVCA